MMLLLWRSLTLLRWCLMRRLLGSSLTLLRRRSCLTLWLRGWLLSLLLRERLMLLWRLTLLRS